MLLVFIAITLAVLIGVLAYHVHIPLPDGFMGKDRKKLQISLDIFHLLFIPSDLLAYLGFADASFKLLRLSLTLAPTPSTIVEGIKTKAIHLDDIPAEAYFPESRNGNGAVIYIHGGGWVLGSVAMYRNVLQAFAKRIKRVIFSIEYRLAPEHPFPAGLEDCEKAVRYLLNEAYSDYNVNPNEIIVAGDSAGGNLAAVVAQRLNIKPADHPLKAQILIYPAVQMTNFQLPSYLQGQIFHGMLPPFLMIRFCISYIGESCKYADIMKSNSHVQDKLKGTDQFEIVSQERLPEEFKNNPISIEGKEFSYLNKTFSQDEIRDTQTKVSSYLFNPDMNPIYRQGLSGLPSSCIVTCGYDVLRDEGYLYAKRMQEAGVSVMWNHYPSGGHGAFSMPETDVGEKVHHDLNNFIEQTLS